MKHKYYKKVEQSWFRKMLNALGINTPPAGTIGPIQYKYCPAGPNRHERRKNAAIWRRYGAKALKIQKMNADKGYNMTINEALKIAINNKYNKKSN